MNLENREKCFKKKKNEKKDEKRVNPKFAAPLLWKADAIFREGRFRCKKIFMAIKTAHLHFLRKKLDGERERERGGGGGGGGGGGNDSATKNLNDDQGVIFVLA